MNEYQSLLFPESRLPEEPIKFSRKFQNLSYIDVDLPELLPFACGFGECGVDGRFHILYEIIDKKNDMNYIGIHTSDVRDSKYMGSGHAIKIAISEHGSHNFERFDLAYFRTRPDLQKAEGLIVNSWFVKQQTNYNLNTGS